MEDPDEYGLVIMAIREAARFGNCLLWKDDETERRVRSDRELRGLTPGQVRRELIAHLGRGGRVDQIPETRPEHADYRHWYKAVITIEGLPLPLFVECVLSDEDPEVPVVTIVNAHLQRR